MTRRIARLAALAVVLAGSAALAPAALAGGNVGWSVSIGGPGYAINVGQPAYWGGYGYGYGAYRPWVRPVVPAPVYYPAPIVYPYVMPAPVVYPYAYVAPVRAPWTAPVYVPRRAYVRGPVVYHGRY